MIYVFLADGFEEIEAVTPVDILRRGGFSVKTIGVTGKTVKGSNSITFVCDGTIDEVNMDHADGVILPGGMPGTTNLKNDRRVIDAVKFAYDNGLLVAAICAAPSILGYMGILNGKKVTCYPSFENELVGAILSKDKCVKDGNIITARGPGAAFEFGYELLNYLSSSSEMSDNLKNKMVY